MQRIQTRTEPPTPNQAIPINSLGQPSLLRPCRTTTPLQSALSIIICRRAAPPTIDPPRPPARLPELPDAEERDPTTICEKFSFSLLMGFYCSAVPVHVNCIVILPTRCLLWIISSLKRVCHAVSYPISNRLEMRVRVFFPLGRCLLIVVNKLSLRSRLEEAIRAI